MDLAKIRKKSLQAQSHEIPDLFESEIRKQDQCVPSAEPVPEQAASFGVNLFGSSPAASAVVPIIADVPADSGAHFSESSPLEIILSGRRASGCESEAAFADDEQLETVVEDYLELLVLRISNEIYGINIMDIKEIIKPREVTEVPRAPSFVTGILSLRGTIIPVIDMRLRLGLLRDQLTGKERIIVIRNPESFSGLLVDEVLQVVRLPRDAVEPAPSVLEGIDREFVLGIGRSNGLLIIILNLANSADIQLY